jgi:corrinoid protein of di/trimethylamine methyltransferase
MANLNELYEAIVAGKLEPAVNITQEALNEGTEPQEIINGYMVKGMTEIGKRFQNGKAFVPNLLMAARAMKGALVLIRPMLEGNKSASLGRIIIGTVKGDLHDIGKNLVASMLEGCGFEVINIGIDVSSEKFVEAVKTNNADILCMSALLTTTMDYMKDVITAIEAAGVRDKIKIMVGGAPVDEDFARAIGADGYSDNANTAVMKAKELMGIQ